MIKQLASHNITRHFTQLKKPILPRSHQGLIRTIITGPTFSHRNQFLSPIAFIFSRNMSSQKEAVTTKNAPAAMAVYNQAIKCNGMVYCSGQLGVDPATGKMLEGSIGERTEQIIKNLSAVLEAAGSNINNVVKVTVFITSMDNFAAVNEVYIKYWGDVKPSRSCVAVHQLPLGSDVEIECIAHLNAPGSKL